MSVSLSVVLAKYLRMGFSEAVRSNSLNITPTIGHIWEAIQFKIASTVSLRK